MAPPPDNTSGKGRPGATRPPPLADSELPTPPHGVPESEIPTPPRGVPTPSRTQAPPMPRVAPVLPPVAARPPPPPAARRPAEPPRPPPVLAAPAKPATRPPPIPAAASPTGGLDAAQLQELEQRFANLDRMDYFQLLKLQPTATPVEIKAAFYRESRTLHPDKFFQLADKKFKEKVSAVYKRLTEAYYVLRDDVKRKRYAQDIASPERNAKLRFTEAAEAETKQQVKKEAEEQIGVHPKGRQFYATAMKDLDGGSLANAERNLKMALTFEPSNARYKEKLAEIQQKLHEEQKKQGHSFKIR